MVGIGAVATLLAASLASLFMAWTIGAGSSGSTPFAPAVGANAVSVMRAAFVVGILGFAGAVLQGENVSAAVGRELVHGVTLSPAAATTGLFIAALLVAVGVFAGYPIATAFTVTGAVIGTGLALGGSPAWDKYTQIALLWVLTPVLGGGTAYGTARWLRSDRFRERVTIPILGAIVGGVVANIEFALFAPPGQGASIATVAAIGLPAPAIVGHILMTLAMALAWAGVLAHGVTVDETVANRYFLLVLGGLVAFSAGGSQVGLAIGPLLPLMDPVGVPIGLILLGGGFGLLLGSWTGAPRMIKAISQDYSSLGPQRSIAALIPSFVIAQIAIVYGIPVSFNEIIVSAVVGSGYAVGGDSVSRSKIIYTAGAWIASLTFAFTAGYGVFSVVKLAIG